MLRKAAFGRTNLFLDDATTVLRDIRCASSASVRHAVASVYHKHSGSADAQKPDGTVCWHCCHGFDTPGVRLPRLFDPNKQTYHVYGWYCSPGCAKAYILEHATFDRGYQMNIFVRMLREVYRIDDTVNEAPPRVALRMFGGPFDIESFREQTNICQLVNPPFVSHCMLVEERLPVADVGEQTQPRGSVRGLRRPATDPPAANDDLGSPALEGMYANYLREHAFDDAPPAKRAKKAPPVSGGGGLARFAAKK